MKRLVVCVVGLAMVLGAAPRRAEARLLRSLLNKLKPTPRLTTESRERQLRRLLPKVDDPQLQSVLDDPGLVIYTDREMPKAYQVWDGQLQGVHAASYNISANDSEPFGNGNREFPWSGPAGTHRTPNVTTFRFLWLPRDDQGRRLPVVWFRKHHPGDSTTGYAWTFPVGTIVGEVLVMQSPLGHGHTFELRVRKREYAEWAVDVYRPFPTPEALAERIKQLETKWQEKPALVKLVSHLESQGPFRTATLVDSHPRQTFRQRAVVDELPPIDDDKLVARLLDQTTFKSCLGTRWRENQGAIVTSAPTTRDSFHVVPANYDAGFVEVDRQSCQRCHETVGQHVNRFDYGRDWYGRIRGSDGIFSFHPFEPGSLSYNGFGQPVQMRSELVSSGLLERYDPARHSKQLYQELK
jgi:hypothetical protein